MNLRQSLTRSCAENGMGPRAVPFHAATFTAFQIEDGRTYAIEGLVAGTLESAQQQALVLRAFSHKQHLLIREEGDRGLRFRLFAVRRRSTPRYEHRNHVTRAVHDLYLDEVCTFDGGVLGI